MSIRFVKYLAIFAVVCVSSVLAADGKKPNIVFIVGEDMGYADEGFHGCQDIPAPNLDALAKAGVRCTNGYVSGPYCSPTPAGAVSGRYQPRLGDEFNAGAAGDGQQLFEPSVAA